MEWLNLHTSILDSAPFLGADPICRATWLCLLRYSIGQENQGRIRGARDWSDRKWQQLCRVTRLEIDQSCDLWCWLDEDLMVAFYPLEKECEVRANRVSGGLGGRSTSPRKAAAARENGAIGGRPKAITQAEPKRNPSENPTEGKGREGKEEEARAREATASTSSLTSKGEEKPDIQKLLALNGIPCNALDRKEWTAGMNRIVQAKTMREAEAFLRWAVQVCTSKGIAVLHWRNVASLGTEWNFRRAELYQCSA